MERTRPGAKASDADRPFRLSCAIVRDPVLGARQTARPARRREGMEPGNERRPQTGARLKPTRPVLLQLPSTRLDPPLIGPDPACIAPGLRSGTSHGQAAVWFYLKE